MRIFCKTKIYFAVISLSLLFGVLSSARAKEKIIWPYVCYKPIYICENGELADGSGLQILNLLWQKLPDYDHELVQMPIKRVLEFAKEGKKLLFYGLYKTPERDSFMEFSIPCRLSTPTYLVIRKNDRARFGSMNKVSLKKVIEDQSLTFLNFNSISFGKGIDEILEVHKTAPNIMTHYDTENMGEKSLRLLINRRVDSMLSLDGTGYDAKQLGVSKDIAYLGIQEQNHYEVGYIIAPENPWGKSMIKIINGVLKNEIPKESFFNFFTPLVDEAMWPELRRQFNEKILAPSQR